ncbi:MAG: hypothetical protein U0931_06680 [Vulcanimicrobiota bacterium]
MTECCCQAQSRGDLCWQGDFRELGTFERGYGEFSFRVTLIQCNRCQSRYEVMADDTPAHRVVYQWTPVT